ncbi:MULTISPECIES: hypothetical protein [Rhizobium]|uniref:Uncharacterized protein n=2 Tax=Rhizobium grahamii TaxID=1120045 RepID=S3HJ01_9HYPH|nr:MULTISPECIES: hypothetical protein [Rhizobium]EPE98707.1 hypothetical protein RGCCGE502_09780 [Rhizobium grahamii CCGE 502]MBB3318942.1 uncharacterized protein YfcZ (UPF0381/DUF406 family) [Rhizobium sp. BK181]MBB3544397.1 uncharacterized protein YfcZ (UPF0381/DUF406 family) [Rhizobium sp. BK399]MCS3742634.1 uncharacterized protein YfcZ (UPF0381/DUF406 family) [Rhizobium sp. BK661]MCS4094600.1 uncharacterized protein YfcZ (UPF0381/DUF406 family) [Rhizobium sp. BK176]
MINLQSVRNDTTHDQRLLDCRADVEPALHQIIRDAQQKGWAPAEVAMAIADAADDYILLLASRKTTSH